MKNEDLRDIVSLFRRYKINIKSLDNLINNKNKELIEMYKKGHSINVYSNQEL